MKIKNLKFRIKNCVFFIFSFLFLIIGWSAKRNVDLNDFLKELTVSNSKDNQTQNAVWLPYEFTVRVLGGDAKAIVQCAALKPYLIFMVQCSDGNSYASWSQIQSRATLQGANSLPAKPLAMVPAPIAERLENIKTTIAGTNPNIADIHVIVFDINDPNGKEIIDTTVKDRIVLTLDASGSFSKTMFSWHSPFDALIDAGTCPKCGDKVKPYWRFCPWCGSKL